MDLRGPLIAIYSFPTVVIFCEGLGIATAKALIEATAGVGGLSFPLRKDVRMYYRVRAQSSQAWAAIVCDCSRDYPTLATSCQSLWHRSYDCTSVMALARCSATRRTPAQHLVSGLKAVRMVCRHRTMRHLRLRSRGVDGSRIAPAR